MNTNVSIMERKENKKILIKEWARINSNGNNVNNNPDFSPVVYKTSQVGRKIPFSIGDNWVERIEKKVYSYKVVSAEDIIIPAGVYKCYKVIEEIDNEIKNCYWFAPFIGLVKWEIGNIKGVLNNCLKEG
ncbi:MAG: hypothetical protein WA277_00875 [Nitrospirota bacterium]